MFLEKTFSICIDFPNKKSNYFSKSRKNVLLTWRLAVSCGIIHCDENHPISQTNSPGPDRLWHPPMRFPNKLYGWVLGVTSQRRYLKPFTGSYKSIQRCSIKYFLLPAPLRDDFFKKQWIFVDFLSFRHVCVYQSKICLYESSRESREADPLIFRIL
mgnify:CR=1 FL=1